MTSREFRLYCIRFAKDLADQSRGPWRLMLECLRLVRCSAALTVRDGGPLPTEFRIFVAGVNESTKGPALFDAAAAKAVMAQFEREGVDQMIDLKHDSLDREANVARADASDAMGWYKLALRDGELWAVDVRWSDEGAARLRSKRQRYTSPAFVVDDDDRVVEMINVALCGMPATLGAVPLVAATKTAGKSAELCNPSKRKPKRRSVEIRSMDPAKIKAALDAIEAGDGDKAKELLKGLIADAASGDEGEAPAAPAEEPPPAEGEELAEVADTPPAEEDDEEKAMAKALRKFAKCESAGEAIAKLEALEARVAAFDAEEAARDASSRRELVGELVKLGAETPATAWEGEPEKRVPVKRLADEAVDSLRARVKALSTTRKPTDLKPPASNGAQLSAADKKRADEITDPVKRAKFVALRQSRSAK